MQFEAEKGRTRRRKPKQPLFYPRFEINSQRAHISDDLVPGFFEGEIQGAFAAPAGRIGELRGNAGLAGSRGAGD
jgi:hypothetical protein